MCSLLLLNKYSTKFKQKKKIQVKKISSEDDKSSAQSTEHKHIPDWKISPVVNTLFHEELLGFHSSVRVGKWSSAPKKQNKTKQMSVISLIESASVIAEQGITLIFDYIREIEYTILSERFETFQTPESKASRAFFLSSSAVAIFAH